MSDTLPTTSPAAAPVKTAAMDMLRSLLMGLGTPLLARGLVTGDELGAIVGGLLAMTSAAWSWFAAHPSKVSALATVLGVVRTGRRSNAWNGDVRTLAVIVTPIIEKVVDAKIKARAGILAAPLDAAANAAIREGAIQAEAAVTVPLS